MAITVRNLQRVVPVKVKLLQEFAGRALPMVLQLRRDDRTQLRQLRGLSVLIISDRRMAFLHRQFLKKGGPTDVITFAHGEIFISAETARRHARKFGTTLGRELQLYIVHGLLHLHGFDDGEESDARKMELAQHRILQRASHH
jgi:probable rRNA maturation factor